MTTQLRQLDQNLGQREPRLQLAWWIQIITDAPSCIYYFGPFDSYHEARLYQYGYIQDLEEEKAEILSVIIGWYLPCQATILLDGELEFE